MIAMIASETFGLPISQIKIKIGDNSYPNSGGSGGSTTIGGVTTSTRKSTVNALDKLFDKVAPILGTTPDQLETVDGRVQVKGNPDKSMSWQQACQKLGTNAISEMGENVPREAMKEGMISEGVGGIQMSDVSVDTETGIVKINRHVAVHDCGLVVNPKTADSQVYGACMLNADMEFYKLAGLGDIGEIIVHMDITPVNDKRGVIGLGEPPTIPGIAAIANAVANAIGVRVPTVPMTPARVLAALDSKRNS
jgi:xanthine dehydrogenase YagR molybdenum-binding subunit